MGEEASELLSTKERLTESVMMTIRLSDGMDTAAVGLDGSDPGLRDLVAEGLVLADPLPDRLVLTLRGRLLGDGVTLRVLDLLEPISG